MDAIYERREVKKAEKIFEEQCKKIEEQKLSHENNLNQFIQSCYKKARSSNIKSNNSCLEKYCKEFRKGNKM